MHFSYGLLLAYPIREVFLRVADVRGFWGYFLPLDLTMSTSMLFELIEWGAAVVFGGELGQAYLGTQGDVWDAHKDMALASLGALIAMLVTYAINRRFQRDFNREWAESLRVKHKKPLGEDALAKLVREREVGARAQREASRSAAPRPRAAGPAGRGSRSARPSGRCRRPRPRRRSRARRRTARGRR